MFMCEWSTSGSSCATSFQVPFSCPPLSFPFPLPFLFPPTASSQPPSESPTGLPTFSTARNRSSASAVRSCLGHAAPPALQASQMPQFPSDFSPKCCKSCPHLSNQAASDSLFGENDRRRAKFHFRSARFRSQRRKIPVNVPQPVDQRACPISG